MFDTKETLQTPFKSVSMVGSIKRKNMAAPASAPPLVVNPHTDDELIVKVTLHKFIDENGDETKSTSFRRGRFRNPSFEDIRTWLKAARGYSIKYAVGYNDEDGDKVYIYTEQDWDECVNAFRERNDKVLKLDWRK